MSNFLKVIVDMWPPSPTIIRSLFSIESTVVLRKSVIPLCTVLDINSWPKRGGTCNKSGFATLKPGPSCLKICPPSETRSSMRATLTPFSDARTAAAIPAGPPPITAKSKINSALLLMLDTSLINEHSQVTFQEAMVGTVSKQVTYHCFLDLDSYALTLGGYEQAFGISARSKPISFLNILPIAPLV